jgi:NADPH:quinone reductase-like Zn-dependent oxidoreductase
MTLAVTYSRLGTPADILELADIGPTPPPGPGQLQVRVAAFAIHPGDLLAIAATPPRDGPLVAGSEATGVVVATGAGVADTRRGERVSFFPHSGAWAEIVNVDASLAVCVPESLSDHVAAQMVCNPLTVVMLRRAAQTHFSTGFDGVILNNAAASSVGRLFTAVAEYHRIASISLVRSDERVQQLRERFPTVPVVSTSASDWPDRVREAAAGRPIPAAFDPVGGAATTDLLDVVAPGGAVYVYGVLSDADLVLHASALLAEEKSLRGISIARWLNRVSVEQRSSDLSAAVALATTLHRHIETAAVYPIDKISDAVRASAQSGRVGTVIVTPSTDTTLLEGPS